MFSVTELMVRQGPHDVAAADLAAPALSDHSFQFVLKLLKLSDLSLDGYQMAAGDPVGLTTIAAGLVRQVEQRANVGDLEAQTPSVPSEGQPLLVRRAICPVVALSPTRRP